jgi:uncharacterized coiled-coil protein SlyX
MVVKGQIRMGDKNQLDFKTNVVINTIPLHGSNHNSFAFMITSDIHKALKEGVDTQNVFNSIVDMRNHIDEWFGKSTIAKMRHHLETTIHNEINNRLDMFHARIIGLERQVDYQEKELASLKNELNELKTPKKVDVVCCDLLSLEYDTASSHKLSSIIEY